MSERALAVADMIGVSRKDLRVKAKTLFRTYLPTAEIGLNKQYHIRLGLASVITDEDGFPAWKATATLISTKDETEEDAEDDEEEVSGEGLYFSHSSNRANQVPLAGAELTLNEVVYIFLVLNRPGVTKVSFNLNGLPFSTETAAPWDFNGGNANTANGYKVMLPIGPHVITAQATLTNGSVASFMSTIVVKS